MNIKSVSDFGTSMSHYILKGNTKLGVDDLCLIKSDYSIGQKKIETLNSKSLFESISIGNNQNHASFINDLSLISTSESNQKLEISLGHPIKIVGVKIEDGEKTNNNNEIDSLQDLKDIKDAYESSKKIINKH